MWVLRTPEGAEPALTFRLLPGNIKTIGRAIGVDFIVDAALVSRVHCRLTAGANEIELVDLDSTNGTFVNGQRIEKRATVKAGDRIGVGRVELEVIEGTGTPEP
jgi:pSer/pThr/pTyr-binding forkhead associated (FHA) protein